MLCHTPRPPPMQQQVGSSCTGSGKRQKTIVQCNIKPKCQSKMRSKLRTGLTMSFRFGPRYRVPPLGRLVEAGGAFADFFESSLPTEPLPGGDGHPVIVYPGQHVGPLSVERLRSALASAGYHAVNWGRGHNHGPHGALSAWVDHLSSDVLAIHAQHRRKVSLLGWSLGGIYAREIARAIPKHVRQVITLACPFASQTGDPNGAWLSRLVNSGQSGPGDLRRLKEPLPVPSTSIYSESDGLVSPGECLQPKSANSENISVNGVSHLGMVADRHVFAIIADRLAQPEGSWKPYAL